MGIGDLYEVDVDGIDDIYYVDAGIYDTGEYGAVYVVDAERPALVDTGIGKHWEEILNAVERAGIDREALEVIAPTHVHLDHAGGAGYLAAVCPNAEVVTHERGVHHLMNPERLWQGTKEAVGDRIRFYGEPKPVPADRVRQMTDGDRVDLGDHALDVHHTPGHAPHQVVFDDPASSALFTADAAGIYVPSLDRVEPTTPPPNFDFRQAVTDVRTLRRIDPNVLCFAHFGPTLRDNYLEAAAASLTEWVESIAEWRAELKDDDAVIEHFVAETDLDEVWGEDLASSVVEMDVRGVLLYLDQRGAAEEWA